jgi:hypothetical protein
VSVEFVGIAPGAAVGQPSYFRGSFTAAFYVEKHWPTRLYDAMQAAGVRVQTARPLLEARGVEVFDFRTTASTGNLTAGQLAQLVGSLAFGVDCIRLAKLTPAQANDPTAVEQQQQQDAAAQEKQSLPSQVGAALGKLGKFVVVVLLLIAVVLIVPKLVRD